MRKIFAVVGLLVEIMLGASVCAAQDTQALLDRLNRLYGSNDVEGAYSLADSVARKVKNPGSKLLATCACCVCNYAESLRQSDPQTAGRQYVRALKLSEDSKYAPTVLYVGTCYLSFCVLDKRYAEGQAVGEEVAGYVEGQTGLDPLLLAEYYTSRAEIYYDLCDYQPALGSYYKAMDATSDCESQACVQRNMFTCSHIISACYKAGFDRDEADYYRNLYTQYYQQTNPSGNPVLSAGYYMSESKWYLSTQSYRMAMVYWDSAMVDYRKVLEGKLGGAPGSEDVLDRYYKYMDYPTRIGYLSLMGDTLGVDSIAADVMATLDGSVSDQMTQIYTVLGNYYYVKRYDTKTARTMLRKALSTAEAMKHSESRDVYRILNSLLTCDLLDSDYSDKKWVLDNIDRLRSAVFNSDTNLDIMEYYQKKGWAEYFTGDKSALEKYSTKAAGIMNSLVKYNFGYLNADEFADFWTKCNWSCSNILLSALTMGKGISDSYARIVYKNQLDQKNLNFISQDRIKRVAKLSPELARDYEELTRLKRRLTDDRHMDDIEKAMCYSQMKYYEKALMKHIDSDIMDVMDIDFNKVRQSLKDGEIAVEFTTVYNYPAELRESHPELCEHYYVAIAFSNRSAAPMVIPVFTESELENFGLKSGQKLKSALEQRQPQSTGYIYRDTALTRLVWGKVLDKFHDVKKIYFSPTGWLYSIAVENLKCSDTAVMSDLYRMVRLSSTAQIATKSHGFKFDRISLFGGINYDDNLASQQAMAEHYVGDTTVFGDRFCRRLPVSALHVQNLSSTYGECDFVVKNAKGRSTTFVYGDSAVEESFKYYTQYRPDIIHVATHGYFDPDASGEDLLSKSGLVFAGVNNYLSRMRIPRNVDDGFLTAAEISELDLSGTRLAVLSACETGLGVVNSNGLFGLERGFKLAGVESVLMSLWEISDEGTSVFMQKFYTELMSGSGPRKALHATQEYMRKETKFKHPYFWAGFVLVD